MKYLFLCFLTLLLSLCPFLFTSTVMAAEAKAVYESIPFEEWESYISQYADNHIGKSTAGAALIVIKDDELVLDKYYGYGNWETASEISEETVFEWASVSKFLVWISVMQLVETGEIDMHEDIREYLPQGFLSRLHYDETISMYHLMNHLAGWEEVLVGTILSDPNAAGDLGQYLTVIEPKQVYRPGTIVCYSNYGTALAGFIVERVSGLPFYEYVNQNIFSVLGMENVTIHPTQADKPYLSERRNQINGYIINANKELVPSPSGRVYWGMYPGAAAIGTIGDAAKLASALIPPNGEASPLFRDRETLNQFLSTSYFYNESYPGIAHGLWEMNYNVKAVMHTGGSDGFSSNLILVPNERLALIVMTNQFEESNFIYNLPWQLLGEFQPDIPQTMPDSKALNGYYTRARKPQTGIGKIYGFLTNVVDVKAVDDNTILVSGVRFTQISPYVYSRAGDIDRNLYSIQYLFFEVHENKVQRISAYLTDFTPLSNLEILKYILSISALAIALIDAVASIIFLLLRKNKTAPRYLTLIQAVSASCIISFSINLTLITLKALAYDSPQSFQPFLWISRINMAFIFLCSVILFVKSVTLRESKRTKLKISVSGLCSILLVISAVFLQLYM